jgi:DNA-binding PadR family transcriptional regulator
MRPFASDLGYALLGLLHQGSFSGYELRKIFTATPLAHFSDSPGAIYPALRRLRGRRWIEPVPHEAPSGRRRLTLRPTLAGRRAFRAWLLRPVAVDDLLGGVDRLILRFAFMGDSLSTAQIARFLQAFQGAVRVHLAALQAFLRTEGKTMSSTGRLAFENGLLGFEGHVRWAERALRQIRTSRPSKRSEP